MSRVLYVDVIGGAAGDMLLAALIDAGAPMDTVREAVDAVVPSRFAFDTQIVRRGGIRARLLRVAPGAAAPGSGELTPRPFAEILEAVERANLPAPIRATAIAVLERIGQAEARVHDVDPDDISLHELGDDDTLLDVVGIAAALASLDVDELLVSSIPLGAGPAPAGRHPHGNLPLPAVATLELLREFSVRDAGEGETVTPTAAAIFAALGKSTYRLPSMTLESIGYGAGNDDPADRANVVRVLIGTRSPVATEEESEATAPVVRELVLLEANLDDLTPELVADAARALFAAGALDVWTTSVQMKKGRPGFVLSALCDPSEEPRLRAQFFESTSTFGVRSTAVRRTELERRVVAVQVRDGSVRVKVGMLHGRVVTASPEHDDVAALADRLGRPVREIFEEAAAAARALRYAGRPG